MNSRENILEKLSQKSHSFEERNSLDVLHVVSNLSDNPAEMLAHFIVEAEKLHYTIHQVDDEKSAVKTILELLKDEKNVLGWDFEKIGLDNLEEALRENEIQLTPSPDPELRYGITGVDAALAATGSIVLASGAGKARVASLLPPIHIAVLRSEQIVRDLETWIALQQDFGEASNVVIISGPSKTADIAMELVLGMHGPQEVNLVLIKS